MADFPPDDGFGLPTLFVPHGAPTFALQPGAAGAALQTVGRRYRDARAILLVSAHWETERPTLSLASAPDTLHDFYGFAEALYAMRYRVPGAPEIAREAGRLLQQNGFDVALDPERGLDHAAWIPLRMMFPAGDVPVVTMAVQPTLGPDHHFRLGRALMPLRESGVLIVGSGNLTHNLRHFHRMQHETAPAAYVGCFQDWVSQQLAHHDSEALLDYRQRSTDGVAAHPSEEHLLPFFVALGAAGEGFTPELLYRGVEYNMLAMDSYAFLPASNKMN